MDLPRALDAARNFELATGIPCALIDDRGDFIPESMPMNPGSKTRCEDLDSAMRLNGSCRESRVYGSYQALRYGGRYTYFCKHALTHITAPLLEEGAMVAAFTAGPMLLIDREEYLRDEVREGSDRAAVRDLITAVPQVSPERAHAIEAMLLFAASWASGVNVRTIIEEEERIASEARVSEYLHGIATMGGNADAPFYPHETERQLLETIKRGDREGARALLAEILASVRASAGADVRAVKAHVLELVVLLSRAAIDGGADPQSVFGVNYRALDRISSFQSVSQMSAWLARIADRFVVFTFDARRIAEHDTVSKALHFMRRNVSQRLGLNDVAAEVNLSPAYFSRLFKSETGDSFTHRYNHIRVERAKDLLLETSQEIVDIAGMVGFSDQSHFTRVFKAHARVTPHAFRRTRGLVDTDTKEIH